MTAENSGLPELRRLVDELSAVDQESFDTLRRFEAVLHRVRPGVPLRFYLKGSMLPDFERISYEKYAGKWRLTYHKDDGEEKTHKPLDEWPRGLARRIVSRLPEFNKGAITSLRKNIEWGRNCIAAATDWIDDLEEELS